MENSHYLTSGILEAHLLGLISEQENQELERLLATDEDVLSDLSEVEMALESYFLQNAVPPPPGVREKIELRISRTEVKKWEEPLTQEVPKSEPQSSQPHYVHVEVDNTHIRVHKHWKTAFIAVFILSKVFLILGLYFYFKANSLEQEVDRLKSEIHQSAPQQLRAK